MTFGDERPRCTMTTKPATDEMCMLLAFWKVKFDEGSHWDYHRALNRCNLHVAETVSFVCANTSEYRFQGVERIA